MLCVVNTILINQSCVWLEFFLLSTPMINLEKKKKLSLCKSMLSVSCNNPKDIDKFLEENYDNAHKLYLNTICNNEKI